MDNSTTVDTFTNGTITSEPTTVEISPQDGLSAGAIIGIIIAILLCIALLIIGGYFIFRKIRERRRNHGEYKPQFEEYHHAKDLPFIQPPSIEGLI
ncbi:unnamed protein product [Dracunculus medinensis]|uniref:4.1m domain-containing protein n=1 Tax=Dracunculus medinensis TaxID=318479 RepID=A0A0N4ULI7_DRAME|nr:unnamed protein product [Dracunculus medinensis]